MSDLMLLGVLRMPIDPNSGPVALTQFFASAREAADRIESDAAEIERLRAALAQQPGAEPDGRLHADGYFTWKRRDGYVLDAKLPCDFYLASPAQGQPLTQDEILERQDWSRVHHALAKHGVHPGRTDDHLADVIDRALAAPAQRQPLSDEQIDSLTFQFLTAELGPTAYDRAIARAIEAAHNITAAPAAQKGEKL